MEHPVLGVAVALGRHQRAAVRARHRALQEEDVRLLAGLHQPEFGVHGREFGHHPGRARLGPLLGGGGLVPGRPAVAPGRSAVGVVFVAVVAVMTVVAVVAVVVVLVLAVVVLVVAVEVGVLVTVGGVGPVVVEPEHDLGLVIVEPLGPAATTGCALGADTGEGFGVGGGKALTHCGGSWGTAHQCASCEASSAGGRKTRGRGVWRAHRGAPRHGGDHRNAPPLLLHVSPHATAAPRRERVRA